MHNSQHCIYTSAGMHGNYSHLYAPFIEIQRVTNGRAKRKKPVFHGFFYYCCKYDYPFTLPITKPFAKCFCKNGYMIRVGTKLINN